MFGAKGNNVILLIQMIRFLFFCYKFFKLLVFQCAQINSMEESL